MISDGGAGRFKKPATLIANLAGGAKLANLRSVLDVVARDEGIPADFKARSCPETLHSHGISPKKIGDPHGSPNIMQETLFLRFRLPSASDYELSKIRRICPEISYRGKGWAGPFVGDGRRRRSMPLPFFMDREQLLSCSFRNCSIVETALGGQRYDIVGCLTHGLQEASKRMQSIPRGGC